MKTLLIAATIATISSAAFAQQAPWYTGDYSASVEQNLDGNVDNGQFRIAFSGSSSAMAAGGEWGNYGPTVMPSDIYSGK